MHLKFVVEVLESKDPETKLTVEELEEGFREFLKRLKVNFRNVRITIRSVGPKPPEKL